MANGQSNYGAVCYETPVDSAIYVCHCSICRSSTGSGGIAVSIVENECFEWLSGGDKLKVKSIFLQNQSTMEGALTIRKTKNTKKKDYRNRSSWSFQAQEV